MHLMDSTDNLFTEFNEHAKRKKMNRTSGDVTYGD